VKPIILVEIAQLLDEMWQVTIGRDSDSLDDDHTLTFPTYREAIAYAATIDVEGDE
jgi:hypothetical protein